MTDPVNAFTKTHGVMTPEELAKANEDRKLIDNKIANKLVTREELLDHLNFELSTIGKYELKIKEITKDEKMKVPYHIIAILSRRINYLYVKIFSLFPVEGKELLDYTEFCPRYDLFNEGSKTLQKVMSTTHNDPEIYITAATYEYYECSNIKKAREYFSEGIRLHKNIRELYVADIWMEMQILEKFNGRNLKTVTDKYFFTAKHFKDDEQLHLKLFDVAFRMRSIRRIQCDIVRDLAIKYKDNAIFWIKLAKLHFIGIIYVYDAGKLVYEKDYFKGIKNAIYMYEKGLEQDLDSDSRKTLFNAYIDDIIEFCDSYRMMNDTIKEYLTETFDRVLEKAHTEKALCTAEHYFYWAEHSSMDESIILQKAIEVIKDDIDIWDRLLKIYLENDHFELAIHNLLTAVKELKDDSLPLWKMMIKYMHNTNPRFVERLYNEGSRVPYSKVALEIRPLYLEWYIVSNDMIAARKLFNSLKKLQPPSKNLYMKMIQFERICINANHRRLRKLYEELCNTFGKEDIEVWTYCIQYEYESCNGQIVKDIYEASLIHLDEHLRSAMTKAYNELRKTYEYEDDLPPLIASTEVIDIQD